jgi:hypothetical protein
MLLLPLPLLVASSVPSGPQLLIACEPTNDLLRHLSPSLRATRYPSPAAAVSAAHSGDTIMVLAAGYPQTPTQVPEYLFAAVKAKGAKLYIEFPAAVPGLTIGSKIQAGNMTFQRLVIASDKFASRGLPRNRLLYAHGAQWVQAGPYRGHHDDAGGCHNSSLSVNKSGVVVTTVEGSWGDLCGAAIPCRVRYNGKLCTRRGGGQPAAGPQSILWESMQNLASPPMHWDRLKVDSVSKWLGFCGISPTGLALPSHLCKGRLAVTATNASGAFCGGCPPAPAPPPSATMIQPVLVSARVAGYDTATFGFNDSEADPSPILFTHPTDPAITVATTKLSSFVAGRYAPLAAWKLLWRELLRTLLPWAAEAELSVEWEAAVHPAFGKHDSLPSDAGVQASLTGVEWLRGRSGLLPGPKQLARISQFLDPRWVDTTSELSNCSYGECKARLVRRPLRPFRLPF